MTLTSTPPPANRKPPKWFIATTGEHDGEIVLASAAFGSQAEAISEMRKQVQDNPDQELIAVRLGTRVSAVTKKVTTIKQS